MSEHTHTYTHEHEHSHGDSEHVHEHTHAYTHDHEGGDVEHTHSQHEHDHQAAHDHEHNIPDSGEKIVAVLDYTLKHNISHADELSRLSEKLKDLGKDDAAAKVTEASEFFAKGNALLSEALENLKNS